MEEDKMSLRMTTKVAAKVATIIATLSAAALAILSPTAALADGVSSTSVQFSVGYTLSSAMSSDGKTIAWADSAGGVVLLDVATNTATTVSDAGAFFSKEAGGLVFSPDGQTLYVANFVSQAGNIVVISVPQAATTGVLDSPAFDGVWTIGISPDGNTLYAAGNGNTSGITVYDLLTDSAILVPSVQDPYTLAVSPDGLLVYNFDYDGNLDVMDTQSNVIIHSWSAPVGAYYNACFNSDMTKMYAPESDGTLYEVSLTDGSLLRSLDLGIADSNTYGCAVAPDDKTVFLTDYNVGTQDAGGDPVTAPGAIHAVDLATFERGASYSFEAVAHTVTMNFFNSCSAYVGGYRGNAQVFDDPSSCHPSLPNTGVDPIASAVFGGIAASSIGVGVAIVLVNRRRAH
jgi:DNA-binding beta-propeller fold protein YncE